MRISRCLFLVVFFFAATHLQGQSSDSFVPILEDSLIPSAEFLDGETTVSEIEIVGLDPALANTGGVYASELIKRLREERIFFLNDKFSGYKVHLISKKVKEWLAESGYEYAKVTALGMRLPDSQTHLRFLVDRGPLIATKAIRFIGNDRVSSAELEENLKGCLGEEWERYDRERYEYFTRRCSRSLMFSKGFFQAKILETRSEIRDGIRTVLVLVAEGPRYKLGKITIEGNRVFSSQEIVKFYGQTGGDVADGLALQDFVYEKLKQKYDELGYVQYNAEFEPDLRPPPDWKQDGIVNVTITIDEGRTFKIRQIVFSGVEEDLEKSLLGEFSLKQGDTFSNQRLQNAIDKFNELDRFECLDKERDVEFSTDEESGEIDMFIALKIYKQ